MTSSFVRLQLWAKLPQKQQVFFNTQACPACMPQLHVCLSETQSSTLQILAFAGTQTGPACFAGSENDARLLQLQGHCLCGAGQG